MKKNTSTSSSVFTPDLKKLKKLILPAVAILLLLLFALNCTYQVKEQEQAVLLTLGQASTVSQSGLHFKIPLIQKVKKVDTTIQGFPLGYDAETDQSIEDESLMITNDYNFVNVDFFVEYQVTDPIKTLYASDDPVEILKNTAQSCIRTQIGASKVDDVLTTGKSVIQSNIKDMIIKRLGTYDLGISLINITIQDAAPPTTEVMEAFKAVETAKQGKETALNNATKYANEKIPAAQAQADQIRQAAQGTKESRINEAKGQTARFDKMYTEYSKYPQVTRTRLFFETMEALLPDLKVVVDTGDSQKMIFLGDDLSKLESSVLGTAAEGGQNQTGSTQDQKDTGQDQDGNSTGN